MSPLTGTDTLYQVKGGWSAGQNLHIWSPGMEHGDTVPGFGVPGTEAEYI